MADPTELCSFLCLKLMQGEFQASELQEAFHGQVAVPIQCVLPHEACSEEITNAAAL